MSKPTAPSTPIKVPTFASAEELAKFIRKLAGGVEAGLNDKNNKSVTREHKGDILNAMKAIKEASKFITPVMETNTVCKTIDAEELMQCVRKELNDFKTNFANTNATQSTGESRQTYASAAAKQLKPIRTPLSRPAIVISTNDSSHSHKEVIEVWRKSVSFKNATYTPARIQPLSKNKVRVEFDTEDQRNATLKIAQGNKNINAEEAKRRNPMVIIKGVDNSIKSEELINLIRHQNPSVDSAFKQEGDIRLCFTRENKNKNLYNAVIETTPGVRRSIVELKRLNIDYKRIHASDFSPFVQCYRCLQFGHTTKKCNATDTPCSHCASKEHTYKECPDKEDAIKIRCYNCHAHNVRNNASVNDSHSATSAKNCPRIKALTKRITERVDYGC